MSGLASPAWPQLMGKAPAASTPALGQRYPRQSRGNYLKDYRSLSMTMRCCQFIILRRRLIRPPAPGALGIRSGGEALHEDWLEPQFFEGGCQCVEHSGGFRVKLVDGLI